MADDDLREELTDIHGIGDAKASEILDVLDDVIGDAKKASEILDVLDADPVDGELVPLRQPGSDEVVDVVSRPSRDTGARADVQELLDEAVDHFDAVDGMPVTAQAGADRVRRAYDKLTVEEAGDE